MNSKYTIYQIDRLLQTENSKMMPFMWLSYVPNIETIGLKDEGYKMVYSDQVEYTDANDCLNELYEQFNMEHPRDFEGHSMSVSDIVKLGKDYYFCDDIGFKKIKCREGRQCS